MVRFSSTVRMVHAVVPALLLLGSAQAVSTQLGLHAELGTSTFQGYAPLRAGAHVAGTFPLRGGLGVRTVLEGGATTDLTPLLRLDLDILKTSGELYYGAGLGSGLIFDFEDGGSSFPNIVFSPYFTLNAHGVLGRNFGNQYLEGVVRAGPISGLTVRYGWRLP